MTRPSLLLFALLGWVGIAFSANCLMPTWTIRDFKVAFGREVRSNAQMSFSITSSMTNKTDAVSCSLRANSRCEIIVAASGLDIMFQAYIDAALFTINQTQTCDGTDTGKYVIGNDMLSFDCEGEEANKKCSLAEGIITGGLL